MIDEHLLNILEWKVQLHQSVEITYVVDGYDAKLFTCDGRKLVASARGETIVEALQKLEELILNFDPAVQ